MDEDFKKSYYTNEWQKKKYHILQRDNFTCQVCGSKEGVMHVHHKTYKHCIDNKCYSCPDEDLITVCEKCHKKLHKGNVKNLIPSYFLLKRINYLHCFQTDSRMRRSLKISKEAFEEIMLFALTQSFPQEEFHKIPDSLLDSLQMFLIGNREENHIIVFGYSSEYPKPIVRATFVGHYTFDGSERTGWLTLWKREVLATIIDGEFKAIDEYKNDFENKENMGQVQETDWEIPENMRLC